MPENYTKILGGSLFSRQSIYAGKDHLLIVSGLYSERYRRIRYADIQCLLVMDTQRAVVTGAFSSVLTGLGVLVLVLGFLKSSIPAGVIGALMVASFLPFALYDLIRGRTCKAALVTAVQQVPLGNVSRIKRFRKLRQVLNEHIYGESGLAEPDPEAIRVAAEAAKKRFSGPTPPPLPKAAVEPPPLSKNPAPPPASAEAEATSAEKR